MLHCRCNVAKGYRTVTEQLQTSQKIKINYNILHPFIFILAQIYFMSYTLAAAFYHFNYMLLGPQKSKE